MARGQDTSKNPNRQVGKDKQYPSQQGAQQIGEAVWGLMMPPPTKRKKKQ